MTPPGSCRAQATGVGTATRFEVAIGGRVLARLVRHLRRTPDRILHPLRRRRALEALLRRPRPATLLIICHGNICRSPFAAALLGRALPGLRVESAGVPGLARASPARARAAGARRGVRSEEHTSELQSPCNLVCRLLL